MSRNAVNFDNPKLLILLGESGHGKSSFVNYLAAKDPDNKELYIAKEGESIFSVGTKQVEIYSFEREDFGKLILVDTEGMNDPENDDNSKIIFNIFHALFSQNSDYVVDAIVYFEVAGKPKFQYEKHLKLFCQIFQLEFEEIQKSTIFVHSKYNNLAEIIKATEHKKKMDEIQAKFKDILQIKWDNKFPFKDQLKELKMATSKTKKFTLTLNAYIDEITEIAKKLREEDIIYDIDYLLTGIICTSVVTVVAQLPHMVQWPIGYLIEVVFGIFTAIVKAGIKWDFLGFINEIGTISAQWDNIKNRYYLEHYMKQATDLFINNRHQILKKY